MEWLAPLLAVVASPEWATPHGLTPLLDQACIALEADAVQVELDVHSPASRDPGTVVSELRAGGDTMGRLVVRGPRVASERVPVVASLLAAALHQQRSSARAGAQQRELEHHTRQFEALQEVARAAGRETTIEPLADAVARQAVNAVAATGAAVIVKATASAPRIAAQAGDPRATLSWAAGFAAAASGVAQVLPGPQAGVPIVGRGGQTLGAVAVVRWGDGFTQEELDRLAALAGHAGVAFSNFRLVEDLRAEQARRGRLAAALVDAQERERKRVAEDLHDGPVQELAGLALMLDALGHELADAPTSLPEGSHSVTVAAVAARRAVGGIRNAIYDLHPLSLEEQGFSAAVRGVVDRLGPRGGLAISLNGLDAADLLGHETRTACFRVVQEALANALRHSHASQINVRGRRVQGGVVMEVDDDGVGFDPAVVDSGTQRGHLGLAVMRERAMVAGGSLDVRSRPGHGTLIRGRFPISP